MEREWDSALVRITAAAFAIDALYGAVADFKLVIDGAAGLEGARDATAQSDHRDT
jgi:hypothetical protein